MIESMLAARTARVEPGTPHPRVAFARPRKGTTDVIDRQSVVQGKSVPVRVDLGGRRIHKQKKITYTLTGQCPCYVQHAHVIDVTLTPGTLNRLLMYNRS